MTWNYRVIRYFDGRGFGLHEVYYDDQGRPWGMTCEACRFVVDAGEDVAGIIKSLKMALKDTREFPVLDEPEKWPGLPIDVFDEEKGDRIPLKDIKKHLGL